MRKTENRYFISGDPAKEADFYALAVIHQEWNNAIGDMTYSVLELDRVKGMDYPEVERIIIKLVNMLGEDPQHCEPNDGPHIVLDSGGLGNALVSYMGEHKQYWRGGGGKRGRCLFAVNTTGGDTVRHDYDQNKVNYPKKVVVGMLDSLAKHRRLLFRPGLALWPEFQKELDYFKFAETPSHNMTFNSTAGEHDDLLSAIYIALSIGETEFNTGQHGVHRPSSAGAQDLEMRLPASIGAGFMQGGRIPGSQ